MKDWRMSLLTALTAAAFIASCTPAMKKEPVGSREVSPPLPISQAELESRAARLAKRLDQAKMGEKEKQAAMDLLNSYQIIGATLQPPMTEGDRQRVIRLLFESLSKLDEQYFQRETTDQPPPPRSFDQYASLRKEILDDYLASAHQAVVNKCIGLQSGFGEEGLTPEIGLLFSVSLSKVGRISEAINVGERVIRELDRNPDQVNLRAFILEWQVAMGQERNALVSLEDLTQRVAAKEALLRSGRQKTGAKDLAEPPPSTAGETPPPGVVASPPGAVGALEDEPAPPDAGTLAKSLAEVKQLIQRKEYTKAKFILLQQRIRYPEGPETASIDEMMRAVEAAEGKTGPEEPSAQSGTADTERIALARKLIEEERYDDALASLDGMEKEGSLTGDLTALKEVATEKLINRERNKAAKLFLMARNEADPGKKGELLSSSLNILKNLLEKYPNSPLKKKINENMTTIRDEMSRVKKKE